MHSPVELEVKSMDEDFQVFPDSCGALICPNLESPLDNEKVDFAEQVANDLREILESKQNDIRVKQKRLGSIV